jgi:D-aminopeptidase
LARGPGKEKNRRPRLRDLGLAVGILPLGRHNAITDVPGVKVGQVTLSRGKGKRAVRCGVTAVIPAPGNIFKQMVAGGVHVTNGFGKSVGLMQTAETGRIETPLLLTSTLNVWRVADALVDWVIEKNPSAYSINPVVMECSPHYFDDVQGRHVGRREVFSALGNAKRGPVEEGNVGGGTGMVAFGHKAGIGTSSRRLPKHAGGWTVGALVQANAGAVQYLRVAGHPFGRWLVARGHSKPTWTALSAAEARRGAGEFPNAGSLICVVATDAPLSARQLTRMAARAMIGVGRAGLNSTHSSGDLALAFSNAERFNREESRSLIRRRQVPDGVRASEVFSAAMEAAEEAYLNAVLRAEAMEVGGYRREALPVELLKEFLEGRKS